MQILETLGMTLVLTACCGQAFASPSMLSVLKPINGETLDTPLSATLEWSECRGAASYEVTLNLAGVKKPVFELRGLLQPCCRVAVRPGSVYNWVVRAVDTSGRIIARSKPHTFEVPEPVIREVTDPRVLFAGVHPG
ncbi:MAG: hypothetical protein N3B12_03045, partial [Armatimonadetes bacterium]|nr:hypothetical protein [Armatimonadota bacterium]